MVRYYMKPRIREYVKGYGFLSFVKNLSNKYQKQLLNTELESQKLLPKK